MAVLDGNPSEETDEYWIYARRKVGTYPRHTSRGGKWDVFVVNSRVDVVWAQIKAAVEEGKLGNEAKVRTALPSPNSHAPNSKVICVYTYDGDDEEDVMRVRDALRKLGITGKIGWKADDATRQGLYQVHGDTRISRYWV